ncbi:hypothetical protein Hs30E_01310 [Lactococcus hodotermopsidis]|uniref:Transglutaminase-like domain-containing protein n=1 Tax=Pseudolactococcus hodotermopsidis TaxID=2709157 RepID=A0A6A0B886_9LACT|nr:transglutaminase domain-containing protein [Lactococcus hodotermopsidis]GFH41580.1 hypothetical protein Hs30E_01310 [Lactococcus hodotermopsidis]
MTKNRFKLTCMWLIFLGVLAGCSARGNDKQISKSSVQVQKKVDSPSQAQALIETEALYYQGLTDDDKQVYRELQNAIQNFQAQIDTQAQHLTQEKFSKVAEAVLLDHPEYFWYSGKIETWVQSADSAAIAQYEISFDFTAAEVADLNQQIELKISDFVAKNAGKTEYDKALAAYQYVIEQNDYNHAAATAGKADATDDRSYSMLGALLDGTAVCEGYADALQYLLARLAMTAHVVVGVANDQNHAWNLVKIDGENYYLDATWGDASFTKEDKRANIDYTYFGMTTAELEMDHKIANDFINLPIYKATAANYFVHNNLRFDSYDSEEISKVTQHFLRDNQSNICFQFSTLKAYHKAKKALFDAQGMMTIFADLADEFPKLSGKKVITSLDEVHLVMTFILE